MGLCYDYASRKFLLVHAGQCELEQVFGSTSAGRDSICNHHFLCGMFIDLLGSIIRKYEILKEFGVEHQSFQNRVIRVLREGINI